MTKEGEKHIDWWSLRSKENPHEAVAAAVDEIQHNQSERYEKYVRYLQAIEQDLSAIGEDVPIDDDEVKQNELRNTIETLHAQIFSNRVIPAVVPEFSDYQTMEKAKELNWFIAGLLEENSVHEEIIPEAGIETLACGISHIKARHEKQEDGFAHVIFERVSALDLFVDNCAARTKRPQTMYVRYPMDREQAIERFGRPGEGFVGNAHSREVAIRECKNEQTESAAYSVNALEGDQIFVWEAWRLPSKPGAKDGKHFIGIRDCTFIYEDWKRDRFPITHMRHGTTTHSFFGQSAVAQLIPSQVAYDKMVKRIDRCHDILGVPKLLVPKGKSINKATIDNVEGTIIEFDGSVPPTEWNPVPITPQAYSERDGLPDKMRSLAGVSSFQTSLQLPTQLREASGKSMEAFEGESNSRHAMSHRNYETAIVDLVALGVDEAEDAQRRGLKVIARASMGRRGIKKVSYASVKMDRSTWKIKVLPVSQLSKSMSARLRELKELRDEGIITKEEYYRVSDVPDTDMERELASSADAIVRKNIDWMIRNRQLLQPLPFDNLDLIIKLTTQYINLYRTREDTFDNMVVLILSQYIAAAAKLKGMGANPGMDAQAQGQQDAAQAMGAPPPGAAPPGAMPPGPPGPPMGPPPPGQGPVS